MRGAVEKCGECRMLKYFTRFFRSWESRDEVVPNSLSLILPMSLKIYLNGVKLSKHMRENWWESNSNLLKNGRLGKERNNVVCCNDNVYVLALMANLSIIFFNPRHGHKKCHNFNEENTSKELFSLSLKIWIVLHLNFSPLN